MLNSKVNFDFSIMKQLWDLAHEKLIIIRGRHGILDEYSLMSATPWNSNLCSKTAQKWLLSLGTVFQKVYEWSSCPFAHYSILANGQLDHSYAFLTMPI